MKVVSDTLHFWHTICLSLDVCRKHVTVLCEDKTAQTVTLIEENTMAVTYIEETALSVNSIKEYTMTVITTFDTQSVCHLMFLENM